MNKFISPACRVAAMLAALPLLGTAADPAQPAAVQQKPATTTTNASNVTTLRRPQVPVVTSPEVLPDRSVVFRVLAPNATEVTLSGEWTNGVKQMSKDAKGVWTLTVGPIEPDLYGYSFFIDGFQTLDPANSAVKPMRSPRASILDVPGKQPALHDFQNVPHGAVHQHAYASQSLGKRRSLMVYTPPGYELQATNRYPVLYLFHGAGDNEGTWTALGRAQWIADNLLAQGKCRPLILVMTDGHAQSPAAAGASPELRGQAMGAFQRDLLQDVMPFVEANYRARPGPTNRAIIGLSMGGGQSLTIGLNHPELFAWVGGMSAAVVNPEETLKAALADATASNARLKLLWFACGKDDFLLKQNKQLDELLNARGIQHEFKLTEGNHSWPVWRRYLADFLPLVFRVE